MGMATSHDAMCVWRYGAWRPSFAATRNAVSARAPARLRALSHFGGPQCADGRSLLQPPAHCGPRSAKSDSTPRGCRPWRTATNDAAPNSASRSNAARARRHRCSTRHLADTPRVALPQKRIYYADGASCPALAQLQALQRAGAGRRSTVARARTRRCPGAGRRSTVAQLQALRRPGAAGRTTLAQSRRRAGAGRRSMVCQRQAWRRAGAAVAQAQTRGRAGAVCPLSPPELQTRRRAGAVLVTLLFQSQCSAEAAPAFAKARNSLVKQRRATR